MHHWKLLGLAARHLHMRSLPYWLSAQLPRSSASPVHGVTDRVRSCRHQHRPVFQMLCLCRYLMPQDLTVFLAPSSWWSLNSQHGGLTEFHSLAEGLLATDGYWGRENQFSSMIRGLKGYLGSSRWPYTHAHTAVLSRLSEGVCCCCCFILFSKHIKLIEQSGEEMGRN